MELIESLASGASVGEAVAAVETSFATRLTQAGVSPEQAQGAAQAAVHHLVELLAHGDSPDTAFQAAQQDIDATLSHQQAEITCDPSRDLANALARGDASAAAIAHDFLSVWAGDGGVGPGALESLHSALAHGESVQGALGQAVATAQAASAAANLGAVALSAGDAVAATMASNGAQAQQAINALAANLPPEQATAFADSFLNALNGGASPAAAQQAGVAGAQAYGAAIDAGAVAISASDHLVSALASGQGAAAALAAAGLTGTGEAANAAAQAFAQALAGGASGSAATAAASAAGASASQTTAAASAAGASASQTTAAASRGVLGDALASALASGAGAEAAIHTAVGDGGNAFTNSLAQALASGASTGTALAQAFEHAQQAAAQQAQSHGPASAASQLAEALASGAQVQTAIDGVGPGQSSAFVDALQHALGSGDHLESAITVAANAAAAAATQQHQASQGVPPVSAATLAMASGAGAAALAGGGAAAGGAGIVAAASPTPGGLAEVAAAIAAAPPSPPSPPSPLVAAVAAQAAAGSPTLASLPGLSAEPLHTAESQPLHQTLATLVSAPQPTTPAAAMTVIAAAAAPTNSLPLYVVSTLTHNDAPLLAAPATIALTDTKDSDGFGVRSGTLEGSDAQHQDTLTYGLRNGVAGGHTVIEGVSYDASQTSGSGTLYLSSTTGAYAFVPNAAAINALTGNTLEHFTVTVSDGSLSTVQSLNVVIRATDDAPILAAPAAIGLIDTPGIDRFAHQTGTLHASDAEHDTLVYGLTGAGRGSSTVIDGVAYDVAQTGSTGTLHLSSTSGAYVFVPDAVAVAALSSTSQEHFTFTVSDGSQSANQTLAITVSGANDLPILARPAVISLTDTAAADSFANQTGTLHARDAEHAALSYGLQGGTSGDTSVIGGVAYDVAKTSAAGTLFLSSTTGAYVFVADANAINGLNQDTALSFTVSASDGHAAASQTLTIAIAATPDTPPDTPSLWATAHAAAPSSAWTHQASSQAGSPASSQGEWHPVDSTGLLHGAHYQSLMAGGDGASSADGHAGLSHGPAPGGVAELGALIGLHDDAGASELHLLALHLA
jgi:VCBS repeat-containing protein